MLLDRRRHRSTLRCEGSFTKAGDALIRVKFDEDKILIVACVDQESLQVGNLEIADVRLLLRLR